MAIGPLIAAYFIWVQVGSPTIFHRSLCRKLLLWLRFTALVNTWTDSVVSGVDGLAAPRWLPTCLTPVAKASWMLSG